MRLSPYEINLRRLINIELEDIFRYSGNFSLDKDDILTWIKSAFYKLFRMDKSLFVFFRNLNSTFDHSVQVITISFKNEYISLSPTTLDPNRIMENAALAISLRLLQEIQPYQLIFKAKYKSRTDYKYIPNGSHDFESMK